MVMWGKNVLKVFLRHNIYGVWKYISFLLFTDILVCHTTLTKLWMCGHRNNLLFVSCLCFRLCSSSLALKLLFPVPKSHRGCSLLSYLLFNLMDSFKRLLLSKMKTLSFQTHMTIFFFFLVEHKRRCFTEYQHCPFATFYLI